jgi:alcohol dehydrogenase
MTASIERQRQLILTAPGRAEWADYPLPELAGAGDALVRPIAVATCDLDTEINAGRFPWAFPYALGHEFVAQVLEIAPDVTVVRPGDVVAVPFQINCGTCARCRRDLTGDCMAVPPLSTYGLGTLGGDWGGAVTDVVRVPYADAMLVRLPAGVGPVTAASLDNLTDAYRAVGPFLPGLDDKRVLVIGNASIGLYAVAIARAFGARVTYVGPDPERADRLGAQIAERGQRLGPFPLTITSNGRADDLILAIKATEPAGVCVDVGVHLQDVTLPLLRMYTVGITLVTGRAASRRDLPAVLDLMASHSIDPSLVTRHTAGWGEAASAWSTHTGKLVLVRESRSPETTSAARPG